VRAASTAQSRVEASSQIRSFQSGAYEDFALSGAPTLTNCAPASPPPCTILLSGLQFDPVLQTAGSVQIAYLWNGTTVDRTFGSNPPHHIASSVTAFSASVSGTAPNQTVVLTITVTVQAYTETQTMLFYPRMNP
jgi:hypothetical protein